MSHRETIIEVRNLEFTYPRANNPVLHGFDFDIKQGEVFGFLGPSGSGKSTTQKILIGLLRDYKGKALVFGEEVGSLGDGYYENVGVAFEQPNHFSKLTALENLNYFRSLYHGDTEDPMELLELVGLQEDADRIVSHFSKGMKVRLNFVRSLINKPKLLFLDEPTAGLDPTNANIVRTKIGQLQRERGTTIFLTTHNMSVADQVCDRVAFIVDGNIELIDRPRDLKIKYGKRTVRVEYGDLADLKSEEYPLEELDQNVEFLKRIGSPELQTIHSQETTLDQIFMEVTGRKLS
jgi:fluoroquinolone transport system ATP-binding protein